MRNIFSDCFRYLLYLSVAIGFSSAFSGSLEDFYSAIRRDDPRTIQSLLQRGFDPNSVGPDGNPGLIQALRDGSVQVALALIEAPATDIDVRNRNDETPLMLAALKGHADLVKRLIARGADINKPGWAPLHYAATQGNLDILRMLLDAHAYIDAESPNGTTPLMMASHYGSPDAVRLLLEAGADASLKNQLGLNAQDFALGAGRPEVADLIGASLRRQRATGTW